MIEPETSEQLLARIHNGGTVTLTRSTNRDGWFQQVRDKQGELVYFKDVSTSFGEEEVFEEWWEHNYDGQTIYNKDSNGLECWYAYDRDGKECGFKDNTGKSTGTFAIKDKLVADELAADEACRGREREPSELEVLRTKVDAVDLKLDILISMLGEC